MCVLVDLAVDVVVRNFNRILKQVTSCLTRAVEQFSDASHSWTVQSNFRWKSRVLIGVSCLSWLLLSNVARNLDYL